MDAVAEFGSGGLERAAEYDLGDQIGCVMADDLASDHFTIFHGGDD